MVSPRHNQVIFLVRDPPSVESLRQQLRTEGCAAITISEPSAAIEAIALRTPDLVLLDWHLPAPVLELVRHCKSSSGIALLVLFGATGGPPVEEVFEFGADDFIQMPFSVREVTARVLALLQRRRNYPAPVLICDSLRLDLGALRVTG